MRRRFTARIPLAAAVGLCLAFGGAAARAQSQEPGPHDAPLNYPAESERWINSLPLSQDMLQGKAVFLWFFEEGCPSCAAKWPALVAFSQQYQDKPIVFLAVNSGTPRGAVQAYVKKHSVPWPVIVDFDRSFEQLCGVNEISLQNIHQVRYVTADGKIQPGQWNDLAATAEQALQGAAWRVDPVNVPEELKPAWFNVEIGNFVSAGPLLKRSANAKNERIQSAAKELLAAVETALADQVADAEEALAADDKWLAYRRYATIPGRFRGYEVPSQVEEQLKALAAEEAVGSQLKAKKQLDAAMRTGSRGTPAAVKRAVGMLEKLVEAHPETDAAKEAGQILATVDSGS